jgi:outer membrane protein assembly factor BamB
VKRGAVSRAKLGTEQIPRNSAPWISRRKGAAAASGSGDLGGCLLATAAGLVFFGEDSGALMAADSATGKPLWSFQTSQSLRASPMTYMFDNKQLVALASGTNILVFGLMD